MRLIDVDKLENDITENITVKAVSRMLAITQGQPTVKAIPIEWINNWLNTGRNTKYFIPMMKMVEEWENREWPQ